MFKLVILLFFIANSIVQAQNPEGKKNTEKIVNSYIEKSKSFRLINIDSAYKYQLLAKGQLNFVESELEAEIYLNEGHLLRLKNKYEQSQQVLESALRIFELKNNIHGKALTFNELGETFYRMGSAQNSKDITQKALKYFSESIKEFELENNRAGLMMAYRNTGKTYRNLSDLKNAEAFYNRGLEIALKDKIETAELGIIYANISQIKREVYKDYNGSINLLKKSIAIYTKTNSPIYLEHANRNLAENYRLLGNFPVSLSYAQKAVNYAEEMQDYHHLANAYDIRYRIQTDMGAYKDALESFRKVKKAEEQQMNMEISDRISEMETKYDTERKENRITLLKADARMSQTQKWVLLMIILFISIVSFLVFWTKAEKRKRELLKAENEKVLEKAKLELSEMELLAKKKELTAKILQLAHKNEFLGNLDSEVTKLKSNIDGSLNLTSSRISRMIKRDIDGDKQWLQFSQEFSSIHKGFLARLVDKFGVFTKSEVRLISLLKMNMNSKEIADIMGISAEGVKKARYRLRKKMNIEDAGLQGYLLSF